MINFEVKYFKDLDLWDVEDELYTYRQGAFREISKGVRAKEVLLQRD